MARKKTLINKEAKKRLDGKCLFCPNDDYALLDCHRITPGEDGGTYTSFNTITLCANCHRRCHDGQIVIDRKYLSTSGRWLTHYWEYVVEKWA